MRYSEFKKAVEDWGKGWGIETVVVVDEFAVSVYVKRGNEDLAVVAIISNTKPYIFDFYQIRTMELRRTMRKPLLEIILKFACTMLADRTDKEKIYRLKHKYMCMFGDPVYLIEHFATDLFTVDVDDSQYCGNREFTLEEIEEIKKKFDTDLKDFELIEVEDEI